MYALVLYTLKAIITSELEGFYKTLFIHQEFTVCYLNGICEAL